MLKIRTYLPIGVLLIIVVVLMFFKATSVLSKQSNEMQLLERKELLLSDIEEAKEQYRVTADVKEQYQESCNLLKSAEEQLRFLNATNTQRRSELAGIDRQLKKSQLLE